MRKVALQLKYKDSIYTGDYSEPLTDEEFVGVEKFVIQIAEGKASYMQLQVNGELVHFPKYILERSILSILVEGEQEDGI